MTTGSDVPSPHPIRTGDIVHHRPSGEYWVVAWADPEADDIASCGWPEGRVRLSDCTVLRHVSENEHLATLDHVLKAGGQRARGARSHHMKPGSAGAAAHGCTCPIIDNGHGRGYMGRPGLFITTIGCPVHEPDGGKV